MTTDPTLVATLAAARQRTRHDRERHSGDTHSAALVAQLLLR